MNWTEIQQRQQRYALEQAIRRDERRRIMRILSENARKLERMGRRVVVMREADLPPDKRMKCKLLAKLLGVSKGRVSAAISNMEELLADFEMQTPNALTPESGKL